MNERTNLTVQLATKMDASIIFIYNYYFKKTQT